MRDRTILSASMNSLCLLMKIEQEMDARFLSLGIYWEID